MKVFLETKLGLVFDGVWQTKEVLLLLAAAALLGISDPLLARLLAGACAYAALAGAALTAVGVRRGNLKAELSVRMRRKGAEA